MGHEQFHFVRFVISYFTVIAAMEKNIQRFTRVCSRREINERFHPRVVCNFQSLKIVLCLESPLMSVTAPKLHVPVESQVSKIIIFFKRGEIEELVLCIDMILVVFVVLITIMIQITYLLYLSTSFLSFCIY